MGRSVNGLLHFVSRGLVLLRMPLPTTETPLTFTVTGNYKRSALWIVVWFLYLSLAACRSFVLFSVVIIVMALLSIVFPSDGMQ